MVRPVNSSIWLGCGLGDSTRRLHMRFCHVLQWNAHLWHCGSVAAGSGTSGAPGQSPNALCVWGGLPSPYLFLEWDNEDGATVQPLNALDTFNVWPTMCRPPPRPKPSCPPDPDATRRRPRARTGGIEVPISHLPTPRPARHGSLVRSPESTRLPSSHGVASPAAGMAHDNGRSRAQTSGPERGALHAGGFCMQSGAATCQAGGLKRDTAWPRHTVLVVCIEHGSG
jgi:hypothetical protein